MAVDHVGNNLENPSPFTTLCPSSGFALVSTENRGDTGTYPVDAFMDYSFQIAGSENATVTAKLDYFAYVGRFNAGIIASDGSNLVSGFANAYALIEIDAGLRPPLSVDNLAGRLYSLVLDAPAASPTCTVGPCPVTVGLFEHIGPGSITMSLSANTPYTVHMRAHSFSTGGGAIGFAYLDPEISIDPNQFPGFAVELSPGVVNAVDTSGFTPLSAVPLPSACWLMLSGLFGLGAVRRAPARRTVRAA
jgi:hypothetical protein